MSITVEELRAEAEHRLLEVEEGAGLAAADAALIRLGLAASPTCLDAGAIDRAGAEALAAGVAGPALHEVIVLVSGLGVHTLMQASGRIARLRAQAGDTALPAELPAEAEPIWRRRVGEDPYWNTFQEIVPDFLDPLLRQSPPAFEAFFDYCALPWHRRTLSGLQMELISLAVDCCPTHRFRPGFLLHLRNAIGLGAGRRAILAALDIAAAAPGHSGVA